MISESPSNCEVRESKTVKKWIEEYKNTVIANNLAKSLLDMCVSISEEEFLYKVIYKTDECIMLLTDILNGCEIHDDEIEKYEKEAVEKSDEIFIRNNKQEYKAYLNKNFDNE
jgi:hypothetical protein